jgi:polysaccharide biosynthesis transport protein
MKRAPAILQPTSAPLAVDAPPPAFAPAAPGDDVDIRRLWKTLVRRRGLIFGIFASVVILVTAFTLVTPRTFTTEVRMIAGQTAPSQSAANGTASTDLPVLNALLVANNGVQSSETYAELLHETPVAQDVINRLSLGISSDSLLGHVSIKPITNTGIISVGVSWHDPQTSAKIANTFASVFVDRERNLIAHQADSAVTYLQEQLPIAQKQLNSAQRALSDYQRRNNITDLSAQTQAQVTQAAALDAKVSQAHLDEHQAQAQLGAVRGQLAQTPATIVAQRNVASNPVSTQLEGALATAQAQLATAQRQYTDNHPAVIALKRQIAGLEAQLRTQPSSVVAGTQTAPNPTYQQLSQTQTALLAQVSASQAIATTAQQQRIAMNRAIAALPEQTQRMGNLSREAQAARDVYTSLENKYHDALLSRTTALSDVTITQSADPSAARVTPNAALNIAASIIIGLILGVITAFVLDFVDDRFRTEDDVKERLGLPILASIPALGVGNAKESALINSLTVESYFELVTALRYSSAEAPRTIAITSPNQGEGKSTIALNIATSMAQLNVKVLIVDADLRRPTLHTKLKIANEAGLSDVLIGVMPLMDAVRPSGHDGVWTLTSGTRAPNPVALLQSPNFDRMLADAREAFDFVILDAPALGPIVDGLYLGMKADGTVLVLSAGQTGARAADAALDKLASVSGLNLIGVVLNRAKPDAARMSSDYYLGVGSSIALPASTRR